MLNMVLCDGWINFQLIFFLDQLVYLKVEFDFFIFCLVILEEVNVFWLVIELQDIIVFDKDLSVQGFVDFIIVDYIVVNIIGGKVVNFVEIFKVSVNG